MKKSVRRAKTTRPKSVKRHKACCDFETDAPHVGLDHAVSILTPFALEATLNGDAWNPVWKVTPRLFRDHDTVWSEYCDVMGLLSDMGLHDRVEHVFMALSTRHVQAAYMLGVLTGRESQK